MAVGKKAHPARAKITATTESVPSPFVFVICQHGVEPTIKSAIMSTGGQLRLAFSRPGLLTFKVANPHTMKTAAIETLLEPVRWAIRLWGWSMGGIRGTDVAVMLGEIAKLPTLEGLGPWGACHVFPRDRSLPGFRGFEPGPDLLCHAIGEQFARALPDLPPCNHVARLGERVLDVVLVEPHHWLIGWHHADRQEYTWPGGVYRPDEPAEIISRAYRKMAEAVAWSRLPIRPGDAIVEIGSAPGGAAQRLLELGLHVVGVDPAEMDSRILQHPHFEHWRGKSAAIKRRRFARFPWLAADMNVAPNYTLDAVEDLVVYPTSNFRGLLLTLKLSSYSLADRFDSYIQRVQSWGFDRVELRQLGHNRREVCLVAENNQPNTG
ncbi:MAG: SAM-dependent methyltransferase [Pirellulaceae bacterium]|nr:MAG: SAM-dependent methyltransferase [Pirellulaceae bacterium]